MGTHAKITKARKSFLRKPSSLRRKNKLLQKIKKYDRRMQNNAWNDGQRRTKDGMLKQLFAKLTRVNRDQTQANARAQAKKKKERQARLQRALLKNTHEGMAQSLENVKKQAKEV
jgi:hypothetical protein